MVFPSQEGIFTSTSRVSVNNNGTQGNNSSSNPVISADGQFVAFQSNASNLVAGDTNKSSDIFVRNLDTNTTTLVTVANNGNVGNRSSSNPVISADGSFVAFDSLASNLVAYDTNNRSDIFVRDLQTGITTRVSVADDGSELNRNFSNPTISGDGRFIAFQSSSGSFYGIAYDGTVSSQLAEDTNTNISSDVSSPVAVDANANISSGVSSLVAVDANSSSGTTDALFIPYPYQPYITNIFVRDQKTGVTTQVSVAEDGTEGNNPSSKAVISADGRFVAFQSTANNLVAEDTNNSSDIFVRDLQIGTTTRISVANDRIEGNSNSSNPVISADGRFIAFQSTATNLVQEDINNSTAVKFPSYNSQIFVRDLLTGITTEVSVADDGTEGNRSSYNPTISADGRFVAFESNSDNLVADDTNKSNDIFVRDLLMGTTTRVSLTKDGTQGNNYSSKPALSADGSFVTFGSTANNLVATDTNNSSDIFVRQIVSIPDRDSYNPSIGFLGEGTPGTNIFS